MSAPDNETSSDVVALAVSAIQQTSPDDNVPAATISRTIARLQGAVEPRKPALMERIVAMPWKTKIGTFVATAAAIALFCTLLAPFGESIAFGQVLDKLRSVKTLSFVMEIYLPLEELPPSKALVWIVEPNKTRLEMETPGESMTMVINDGKVLTLTPETHMATLTTVPSGQVDPQKTLNDLRAMTDHDAHPLDEKVVDGVRCKGFEAARGSTKSTLWADARTGQPVRIEMQIQGGLRMVCSNFKFDHPFDPSLFSLEPPTGYTIQQIGSKESETRD